MKLKNITNHPIEGIRCNCGMQSPGAVIIPVLYERATTDYGPVARLRCPCGYRTEWHLRCVPGDLAREWIDGQRRARVLALTANWPRDARDRRIRELEARCRELEWAREEAEVLEWGRLRLGEMAEKIEDLQDKNADYIERLHACGKAANSAEKHLAELKEEWGKQTKALGVCLRVLEDRHGTPEEWADVQETTRTANARAAILLSRHVLGKDAATSRKGAE